MIKKVKSAMDIVTEEIYDKKSLDVLQQRITKQTEFTNEKVIRKKR